MPPPEQPRLPVLAPAQARLRKRNCYYQQATYGFELPKVPSYVLHQRRLNKTHYRLSQRGRRDRPRRETQPLTTSSAVARSTPPPDACAHLQLPQRVALTLTAPPRSIRRAN